MLKKILKSFLVLFVLGFVFLAVALFHDYSFTEPDAPPRQVDQTLFIALDGIPFAMVDRLYKQGKLSAFAPPSRVIATFPSTTTSGFTGLLRPLGAKAAPGYDGQFFSYSKNKVLGHLLSGYDYEPADYHRLFSFNRNTFFQQVVMYTSPRFAAKKDLNYLKQFVWGNPQKARIFFYIGSTDGSGHLDGEEKTEKLFLEVMEKIEALRKEYQNKFGRNLTLVFFSDHGFYWERLKKIDIQEVEAELRKADFQLSEHLKEERNVVSITWGNISGGDFYLKEQHAPEVAKILAQIPGVNLVTYRSQSRIFVLSLQAPQVSEQSLSSALQRDDATPTASRIESAEVLFSANGERFGYRPIVGDPLHYGMVQEELRKEGKLDSQGLALAKDWFEKTQDHSYPDALYRLWDGYFGLVQNPAVILLSTYEDYEFGDSLTRLGASIRGGLRGTHGALGKHSSNAFILTNDFSLKLPPVLRYDEALLPFRSSSPSSMP